MQNARGVLSIEDVYRVSELCIMDGIGSVPICNVFQHLSTVENFNKDLYGAMWNMYGSSNIGKRVLKYTNLSPDAAEFLVSRGIRPSSEVWHDPYKHQEVYWRLLQPGVAPVPAIPIPFDIFDCTNPAVVGVYLTHAVEVNPDRIWGDARIPTLAHVDEHEMIENAFTGANLEGVVRNAACLWAYCPSRLREALQRHQHRDYIVNRMERLPRMTVLALLGDVDNLDRMASALGLADLFEAVDKLFEFASSIYNRIEFKIGVDNAYNFGRAARNPDGTTTTGVMLRYGFRAARPKV